MATHPYSYGEWEQQLTLDEMRARPQIARIDPEMWRRLRAMMEAAAAVGVRLGIGGAWRSSLSQRNLFLDRHQVVPSGGCCGFEGKRYALKKGAAHAAPPGRSYHEETTPAGHCLAVDMVGDLRWMNANCARFGLRHFANVGNEPWHVQPVEVPSARAGYVASRHHPLPVFALPTPTPVTPTAPVTPPYPGTPVKRGSKGPNVVLVQRKVGATPDGDFGPKTEQAVIAWQKRNPACGPADGIVGPRTWKVMFG